MTPTQDLFLEALSGRIRSGEKVWTFDSRHRNIAEALAEAGLVWWKHGTVERTILVGFTERGRSAVLSSDYHTPIEKQLRKLIEPTASGPVSWRDGSPEPVVFSRDVAKILDGAR
jgi:hypothetical protein